MKPIAKSQQTKGTWWQRAIIRFLTFLLTLLIFWLLGFFVEDIRSIEGPKYADIEAEHLEPAWIETEKSLRLRISDLDRSIKNESEKQRVLGDGSHNLQQTLSQLLELQKLSVEKNATFSQNDQNNLTSTLNLFLDNQRQYQDSTTQSSRLVTDRQDLQKELDQTEMALRAQRQPAQKSYDALQKAHQDRLGFLQLLVLIPILGGAAYLIGRQRASMYFPLYLALGLASLFKVALVIHEYFPSPYFKYVLIGSLLAVVSKMLIHFIRSLAQPKIEGLVKQYREAYERFFCPVCEYPIRTGPRRHLFWTRRSVSKLTIPNQNADEEAYTCPSCGKDLYSECSRCHKIRHSLLPHCQHCGEKSEMN